MPNGPPPGPPHRQKGSGTVREPCNPGCLLGRRSPARPTAQSRSYYGQRGVLKPEGGCTTQPASLPDRCISDLRTGHFPDRDRVLHGLWGEIPPSKFARPLGHGRVRSYPMPFRYAYLVSSFILSESNVGYCQGPQTPGDRFLAAYMRPPCGLPTASARPPCGGKSCGAIPGG